MAATAEQADTELLERGPFLEALAADLAAVAETGEGRLVLVTGEAGAGKTVLLKRFCRDVGGRVLTGACDSLLTPRALGPFVDVAEQVGGPLRDLVDRSPFPRDVLTALFDELRREPPALLVLEDLHWADGATLDVLRLLGRRIDSVPALVVGSLRDDELDRLHPMRIVLGELATSPAVRRLALPPLSRDAVRKLAARHRIDGDELHERTGGNAFYVTEVLESGSDAIPATVRDAVLARAARLSDGARRLLDAISVAQPHAELGLLQAIAPEDLQGLDECLACGMVRAEGRAVAFRHELERLALEESIPPDRRLELHRRALRELAGGDPDPARVAHHAEEAGDADAVLSHAPAAGARALRLMAFREAGAQYGRALRFADDLDAESRAQLFEQRSLACYLGEELDDALVAREEALACIRATGDPVREGESVRWLARILWSVGRTAEASDAARQAAELLEPLGPTRQLAGAYATVGALRQCADDNVTAGEWADKAIALAEDLGDTDTLCHALITRGNVLTQQGDSEGIETLERSVALAAEAGLDEHVIRGLSNVGLAAVGTKSYAVADRALEEGIEILADAGISAWSGYLFAMSGRSAFEQGRWDEAVGLVERTLARPGTLPFGRLEALVVLGRVRARRGDPGVWPVLDEAQGLAKPTNELQQIAPVAIARAEAALLEGDADAVAAATDAAFALSLERGSRWLRGELALLRRRAGIEEPAAADIAEPYALALAGDWRAAAERWDEIGCPYEAADALAEAGDEDSLRRALAEFERFGARPAAVAVAGRLRELVARGPRPATAENPANLTPRELEVLALVAEGLRNAEIAERLVVSQRTVDHHVSAILRKLGARSRAEAGRTAARMGLVGQ